MRLIVLAIAAFLIVSGCLGGGPAIPNSQTQGTQVPGTTPTVEKCTSSYSFSQVSDGMLSKTTRLVATVTCAAGKNITVKLDDEVAATVSTDTNATTPLNLDLTPTKDGVLKLTVESDGEIVFSRDWTVVPLGNADTRGIDYDPVSFKEWRAMAFEVETAFKVGRVRIFMKRLQSSTQPGTNIVVEIRKDNGDQPGEVKMTFKRPINATTLSDNWINFDVPLQPPIPAPAVPGVPNIDPLSIVSTLNPGRYWVVLKIEQTDEVNLISDVVNVHYVTVDRQTEGNNYTKQMYLTVDPKTGYASETQWTPLSYDRTYSITINAAK